MALGLSESEADEEEFAFPGHATSDASLRHALQISDSEEEEQSHAGTFAVVHKRRMIFTQQVEIKTQNLPRWKPRVIIDRRMLEDVDE